MARAVTEWIGRNDDAKVPGAVQQRVFEAYGRRCYLSGKEIRQGDKWEIEHKTPLWLGGEHRESNLAPALVDAHQRKTAAEAKIRAKINRIIRKQYSIRKPSQFRKPAPDTHYEAGLYGLRLVKDSAR